MKLSATGGLPEMQLRLHGRTSSRLLGQEGGHPADLPWMFVKSYLHVEDIVKPVRAADEWGFMPL